MSDRDTWPNQDIGPDAGTSQRVSGNWVARHDLFLYFLLAYVLSWAVWPLVLINPQSSPLVPFGPLLAAVIVALLAGGWRELRALLGQLLRWRVHPIWYVIGLLGPFVLAAGAAALTVATGGTSAEYRRLHRLAGHWCSSGLNDRHRWTVRGGGLARFRASQDAASSRRSLGGTGARSYLGSLASARADL